MASLVEQQPANLVEDDGGMGILQTASDAGKDPVMVVTPCKEDVASPNDGDDAENRNGSSNNKTGSDAGDTVSETSVISDTDDALLDTLLCSSSSSDGQSNTKTTITEQDETTRAVQDALEATRKLLNFSKEQSSKSSRKDADNRSSKDEKQQETAPPSIIRSNPEEGEASTKQTPVKGFETTNVVHCIPPSPEAAITNISDASPSLLAARQQNNRVSVTVAAFANPDIFSSPSRNKTTAAPTTGLSELSKQLRVLQAKNRYLQSEMERCQRQLKIMSESKGVSVKDVLASLEFACAQEAHGELQSQIAGLQAQLEALRMSTSSSSGNHPSSPSASPARGVGSEETGTRMTTASEKAAALKQQSFQQEIAALQLQVGEHEEMEDKLKEETNALYQKVQTHQTAALTLEATCAQQQTLLELEKSRTAELEALVASLQEERDVLKDKQTKKMTQLWSNVLSKSQSADSADDAAKATDQPADDASLNHDTGRPMLQRTFSDPALWCKDADAKASVTNFFVPSRLPKYSSTYKQWTYNNHNGSGDSRSSSLYVKQSAKNMELELLCRHQQQQIQDLRKDHTKGEGQWKQLELERNEAQTKRNVYGQQLQELKLALRLEQEQCKSLRNQLECREEEHTLKKEQLESRLQVHKERTVDLEGQLSSLYVAYELLQEDRSEEQAEQAQLLSRLSDADSAIAQHMSRGGAPSPTATRDDPRLAQQLSEEEQSQRADASETTSVQMTDLSERSSSSGLSAVQLRQRASLLTPSPIRKSSARNLFVAAQAAAAESLPPSGAASAAVRRASTGSAGTSIIKAAPPPGTTICKGYLWQQQPKKKTLLREVPASWKRKYMVLKRGDSPRAVGSYSLWYGDAPQGKVRGTIAHIVRGISTVTFNNTVGDGVDAKPYSFFLSINPRDPEAPVIQLAGVSGDEVMPWKTIWQEALGIKYEELPHEEQQRADGLVAFAKSKKYAA